MLLFVPMVATAATEGIGLGCFSSRCSACSARPRAKRVRRSAMQAAGGFSVIPDVGGMLLLAVAAHRRTQHIQYLRDQTSAAVQRKLVDRYRMMEIYWGPRRIDW